MAATDLGCSPGMPLYNPDRGPLGADPNPLPLDPECKECGGCGGSCGCAGSCGGSCGACGGEAKNVALPALDRAREMAERLKHAIPPLPGTELNFPMGGSWRLNIATGNAVVQLKTPAAGLYDPRPVLTYNSLSSVSALHSHS